MYCHNCNFFNDDNAKFCNNCGSPLNKPSDNPPPQGENQRYYAPPQNAGANGQPNCNYGMPGRTPYDRPNGFAPQKVYTNIIPIVSSVLGVVSVNMISIVLGIFALVKFNEYDRSRFTGGILSDSDGRMSRTLGIASIVISCVGIVLSVLSFVAALFGMGFLWSDMLYDIFNECEDYYYYSCILLGMF